MCDIRIVDLTRRCKLLVFAFYLYDNGMKATYNDQGFVANTLELKVTRDIAGKPVWDWLQLRRSSSKQHYIRAQDVSMPIMNAGPTVAHNRYTEVIPTNRTLRISMLKIFSQNKGSIIYRNSVTLAPLINKQNEDSLQI